MKDNVRGALEKYFLNPTALSWYIKHAGTSATDAASAAADFLQRAAAEDISPARFFDPGWFRATYRVEGVNAFLSYLSRKDQRFAWPSPMFAPRWYARRYHLGKSATHPFLEFLSSGGHNNPHPLIDQAFLASQCETWASQFVALEFVIDPSKYRLKPHPLFDSPWYLEKNPDVAQAGVNPLEHYLYHGHHEGRDPNRIFKVAWYRDIYFGYTAKKKRPLDPLTHYATIGFLSQREPAPSLSFLAKVSTKLTAHGPARLIDALENDNNIYAGALLPSKVSPVHVRIYLSGPLHETNLELPERILILPRQRVGLMYTPKCASAKLVYWWLKQLGLLDIALRFSPWSHDFERTFHESREYIAAALRFQPKKKFIYKFVRNPVSRTLSAFRHCLQFPERSGLSVDRVGLSFHEFLDLLHTTNYFGNAHFVPQMTALENAGRIQPIILKIEDGVDAHLRMLEERHALPPHNIDVVPEIYRELRTHLDRSQRKTSVGPDIEIRYGRNPDYRMLVTDDVRRKIYALYRADFDAYGYSADDAI